MIKFSNKTRLWILIFGVILVLSGFSRNLLRAEGDNSFGLIQQIVIIFGMLTIIFAIINGVWLEKQAVFLQETLNVWIRCYFPFIVPNGALFSFLFVPLFCFYIQPSSIITRLDTAVYIL